jgi:hypothetical protein
MVGAAVALLAAAAPAGASAQQIVGAGNLPGCLDGTLTNPRPLMQMFHATMLRVVVSQGNWHGNAGQALPCVRAARAEGYRVQLDIEWASWWPVNTVRWWFWRELSFYRYYASAISVGNEQEIVPPNMPPWKYAQMWRAVEPLIRRAAPWAVRVGGEISPWGLSDLQQELALGLPGIQAVAVHPYVFSWGYTVGQAWNLAWRYHVQLWCDEGLRDGPDSWPSEARTLPLAAMHGCRVADVWDKY